MAKINNMPVLFIIKKLKALFIALSSITKSAMFLMVNTLMALNVFGVASNEKLPLKIRVIHKASLINGE